MHKLFREALEDATGESRRVIVVFIDIRGFSNFSQQSDSVDVAAFIRKVYMKIIDTYFDFASFFKSTGDGLLLTIPWEEKDLQDMSQKIIDSCMKCHSEFGTLFADDPSINFDVPNNIGIGVSRGSACCLVSGDKTIDYSGRLLNLAARLTDLARPAGIVVDGAFVVDLLTPEQQKIFKEDNVYLKGIHEDEPIQIYYTPEFTTIPRYNKQPIAEKRWKRRKDLKPFRDLFKFERFRYELESEPLSEDDIKITVEHLKVIGGKATAKYAMYHDVKDFTYSMQAGKPIVSMNFATLRELLKQHNVKKNMGVAIEIAYVEK